MWFEREEGCPSEKEIRKKAKDTVVILDKVEGQK